MGQFIILNAVFKKEKELLATITRSMQQGQTPKGSFWKGEALEETTGPLLTSPGVMKN